MKKIFTLMSIALLCNFSNKAFGQNVYQTFETQADFNNLISSCWSFTNVNYSSVSPINGTGDIITQLGVSSEVVTPDLQIPTTLNISFSYFTAATNSGSKTLKVFLLLNGVETQLESINLNSIPSGNFSNSYTNANTPGQNINGIRKIIFRVNNNASVRIDELNINAPYAGSCGAAAGPLPVKLVGFQGNLNNNKVTLQWNVAENEINGHFEVEKSIDGKEFSVIGSVNASSKSGNESYSFTEITTVEKAFYRLKMFDKNQVKTYSKIIVLQNKLATSKEFRVINNPVSDKLTLSIASEKQTKAEIRVYNLIGCMQLRQMVSLYEGNNQVSLSLTDGLQRGIYFVEMINGIEKQSAKFIKQ